MSPQPHRAIGHLRQRAAGITLVELVIVLMVMAVLTRIAHDLRLARTHAQSASASQSVAFNSPGSNKYELTGVDDPHRPGKPYEVNVSAEPYLAFIVTVNFGGDATVTFDGYGQPDSGGTVTVQSGAHQKTVTVDAETGKVDVS